MISFGNNLKKRFDWLNCELKGISKIDFFDQVLFVFLFLSTGYTFLTFSETKYKTIFFLLTFILCFFRYFLSFDVSFFARRIKRFSIRQVQVSFLLVLFFGCGAVVTMLARGETGEFFGYVDFGLIVLSAFFIARSFTISRFVRFFNQTLFALSLVALFFYFSIAISGQSFGVGDIWSSIGYEYGNYFFLFFQNVNSNRLQSIFWEPGLFSSFLLFGLALDILFSPHIHWQYFFIYTLCIVLSLSTAGYVLYCLVLLLLVYKKIANKKTAILLIAGFSVFLLICVVFRKPIVGFLAQLMPSVFGKVLDQNQSFTTRLYSPVLDFLIFLRFPLTGAGFTGVTNVYENYLSVLPYSELVNAQTSTSGVMIASYGLVGFLYTIALFSGIFGLKKISLVEKIIFSVLFFFIVNKEPHTGLFLTWCLLFLFVYDSFDRKKEFILQSGNGKPLYGRTLVFESKNDRGLFSQNVLSTFLIKGVALAIGFFSIPVYSAYFGDDSLYGVWLTLLSILGWVATFDLGFGNGMKNRLIKALSIRDDAAVKKILASTYIPSFVISGILLIVGIPLFYSIDLNSLLNVDSNIVSPSSLTLAFVITYCSIVIELSLKNIVTIYQALQKNGVANLFNLFSSIVLFVFAAVAKFSDSQTKIFAISWVYAISTITPYVIVTTIAFATSLKRCRPHFRDFSKAESKSIISLGLVYFAIQLCLLFLNSTDQLLISNLFGSASVVPFTKYSKLFNVVCSLYTIFSVTLWSFIYKAIVDKNASLIRKYQKIGFYFAIFSSLLCLLFFAFLQPILDAWLGDATIVVDWPSAVALLLFSIASLFLSYVASFSNAFQTLKPQLIVLLACSVAKIPLVYLLHYVFPSLPWMFIPLLNALFYVIIFLVLFFENNKKMKITFEAWRTHEK